MAVYVDESKYPFRGQFYCHMWADTLDELHVMADRIGLQRSWFQTKNARFPHYDLAPSKRAAALRHGAVVVADIRMVVRHMQTIERL